MDAPSEVYLEYDRIQTFGIRSYPGVLYPCLKYPLNNALHLIYKSKGNISFKEISKREVISERQIH